MSITSEGMIQAFVQRLIAAVNRPEKTDFVSGVVEFFRGEALTSLSYEYKIHSVTENTQHTVT